MLAKQIGIGALLVGVLLWVASCNPCGKLAKSKNIAEKDSAAFCYYNRGKFESASLLFEELLPVYRGLPRAELILYYYSYSKYKMGDYITSAHFFKEHTSLYPNSEMNEDCMYMIGHCYQLSSNEYQLDQNSTNKALEQLQYYVQIYPNGKRKDDANQSIAALRGKLAKKAFQQANLYLKIGRYQAAAIAFKYMLADFPDSEYNEEAYFKMLKSQALFAQNSVEDKKRERYMEAATYYLKFIDKYPQSKFLKEAETVYNETQNSLKNVDTPTDKKKKKNNT